MPEIAKARFLSLALAALLCATSVGAEAQVPEEPERSGPGRGIQFRILDRDGDGFIGADEAALHYEEIFSEADDDDDGVLTLEEYLAVHMGPGAKGAGLGPRRQAMERLKRARFESMDADRDGVVRKLEFLAAGRERYRAADTDGDGKVSVWEFRAARDF